MFARGPCWATAGAQIASLQTACERIAQPVLGCQVVLRRLGSGPALVLLHERPAMTAWLFKRDSMATDGSASGGTVWA